MCVCVCQEGLPDTKLMKKPEGVHDRMCVRFTVPHFEEEIVPRKYLNVTKPPLGDVSEHPQLIKRLIHLIKNTYNNIYVFLTFLFLMNIFFKTVDVCGTSYVICV